MTQESTGRPIPPGGARLRRKRKIAKAGMSGSLAALVLTGLARGRGPRSLHVAAGVAFLVFTVWHSRLYPVNLKD
ncbi:MAG: hypothetical protein H7841_07165 [Magnetospirillum sp. WYHS-4]